MFKIDKIIFHIDVNAAYLSWTAANKLVNGEKIDIRKRPSVIGGDEENRHGIVLAKSDLAKKYKVETGESLYSAKSKCPNLEIYPADYSLFLKCSNAMVEILKEYTDKIQRYSVDECFLDMTLFKDDYLEFAKIISDRIKNELGFTCNIGISTNKLLAKVASDCLGKPNKIHTLFKHEIKDKMWPLDIRDLFMVGAATERKLRNLNINTIGDLASYDKSIIKNILKSHGVLIQNYANGIDNSEVRKKNIINIKGLGSSTTLKNDTKDCNEIDTVLLSLTENTAMRLRKENSFCKLVTVTFKNSIFVSFRHQKKMNFATDATMEIYKTVKEIFYTLWNNEEVRQLSVRVSDLYDNDFYQMNVFDEKRIEKLRSIDSVMDNIRKKYGNDSIMRCKFLGSEVAPLTGGVGDVEYPVMSSVL